MYCIVYYYLSINSDIEQLQIDMDLDSYLPNCILGHELKKILASSRRKIECNECGKIILRKQPFWGCNFCVYDLCIDCYINCNNSKDDDEDDDEDEVMDNRTHKIAEILPTNDDNEEDKQSTDDDDDDDDDESLSLLTDINSLSGELETNEDQIKSKRTPISFFLNSYPQHPKIQQEIRLSLKFYDNPQQSKMQYPNTNSMQFPYNYNYNYNNNKKQMLTFDHHYHHHEKETKLYPPEFSK